jgi:triphosphatase
MTEFELKLEIPAHRTQAVAAAVRRGRTTRQRLQARYFDTHDRALAAHGIVVRLRKEGRQWVQTAKAASGRGALERLEHNVLLAARSTPAPDLARHTGTPLGKRIQQALKLKPDEPFPALELVYRTDVVRLSRAVRKGSSTVEIALDAGRVCAGDRSVQVNELELELKKGSPADAVELARSWCLAHGLWISVVSKSMRGQRLAAGQDFGVAVNARMPSFKRDASGGDLAAAVVSSCLDQILPNASDIAAGCTEAEHIHQLRVGLRRLRTAMRELGARMPEFDSTLEEPLVAAFRDLGQHRDRSHLVDTVQKQIAAAGGPPLDWTGSLTRLPNVGASVRSPAFQKAVLGLIAFVHAAPEEAASQETPKETAPRKILRKQLDKLHRRLVAGGRQFLALEEPAQHRLRKQAKRLRYLVEFAQRLFGARKVEAYVSALKPVQDAMGSYHDELAALQAWQQLASHDPRAWFGVGWLSARRPANAQACLQACETFADQAKPAWD